MRILVTGAKGMLGTALVPVLRQRHQVWGIDVGDCDICDAAATSVVLRTRRPELVIPPCGLHECRRLRDESADCGGDKLHRYPERCHGPVRRSARRCST
ncbi:MAG: sugar nucleotide-binding protein [Terriglobia bacterium]